MPQRVLALIDEEARRAGESRSGFLAKAAFEYIDRHRGASRRKVVALYPDRPELKREYPELDD